jgi:hypothetical protein
MDSEALYYYESIQIKSELMEEPPQTQVDEGSVQRFSLWTVLGEKGVELMSPVIFLVYFFHICRRLRPKMKIGRGLFLKL